MKVFLSLPHTPQDVRDAICNSLQLWLDPSNTEDIIDTVEKKEVTEALKSQYKIGWQHFVRGRVSIDWGAIINVHLQTNKITNITAEQWGSKMLAINWKFILQIWSIRNEETLGKTNEDVLNKRRAKVLVELQHISATNQDIAGDNADILNVNMEEYQKMNANQVETILYSARILAKINKRKRKELIEKNKKIEFKRIYSEGDPRQGPEVSIG
jgi:hypothetical protein